MTYRRIDPHTTTVALYPEYRVNIDELCKGCSEKSTVLADRCVAPFFNAVNMPSSVLGKHQWA